MTEAPDLNEDFVDLITGLRDAGVEFLIVGAHALAAHGVVRSTGDLDIFVRPTNENSNRVAAALRAFGAPLAAHGVTAADFARAGTVYPTRSAPAANRHPHVDLGSDVRASVGRQRERRGWWCRISGPD